jgi:membrane protein YqaA with SNARE-associated domain
MTRYLFPVAIIFLVNLMPVFGPPTWSLLVLFRLNSHLSPIPLVILGALAAGSGRYLLAIGTGLFRSKISVRQRVNLEAAGELLINNKKSAFAGLVLFVFSPIPSAQLFEAAGLIGKKLIPFTLAFFTGRLLSYSLYVAGASQLKNHNLGEVFISEIKSPLGIGIQILSLAGIFWLTRIDWRKFIHPPETKR